MPKWEVVGGADKGGILVREGQDLKSPQTAERLSTGAIVDQLELAGDRLHYKLVTGTGPAEGWVSIKLSGKELCVPKEESAPAAPTDAAEWPSYREAVLASEPVATTLKQGAPWLSAVGKAPAKARVRLVMFNWTGNRGGAGSAHQFMKWPKFLGEAGSPADTWEVCQVNYTGRGSRMKEPLISDATEVATAVADALQKAGSIPTVFFGFSFGAILAYETALLMAEKGSPPYGVVVASAEHPAWAKREEGTGPNGSATKDLSAADFEKMLHEKGGTEAILQSPDMKKMYLPVILSDMVMEEAYGAEPPPNTKLACPVVVFRGKTDKQVLREHADPWLEVTGCGDGTPSRVEELDTGLAPTPQGPWLSDWYLCQGEPSMMAMIKAIAKDFGGAKA